MSKQHTTPCAECPFSRTIKPGALGCSAPAVYIGQVFAGMWIPCHATIDYVDLEWKTKCVREARECAGAAIFRANCAVPVADVLKKSLTVLPANGEKVFAAPAEFVAHHLQMSYLQALRVLAQRTPADMALEALAQAGVRVHLVLRSAGSGRE